MVAVVHPYLVNPCLAYCLSKKLHKAKQALVVHSSFLNLAHRRQNPNRTPHTGTSEVEEQYSDLGWTSSNLAQVFKIQAFTFLG